MGIKTKLISKISRGFQQKQRTKKEVDEEYTKEAIWLGHKTRMAAQLRGDLEKLEAEIDGHLQSLLRLNDEGMKIPPEMAQNPPTPAPETPTEPEAPTDGAA